MSADPPRGDDELEEYEAWSAGSAGPFALGGNRWEGIRPSRMLALGLLLVPFNFHVGRFDLLPNPLGWLLAVWALHQMAARHRLLTAAMWWSAGAFVLSCVSSVMTWAGSSARLGPVAMVEGLLPVLVSVLVCTALIGLVGDGDRSGTRQATIIRAVGPVLALAMVVLAGASLSSSGLTVIDQVDGPAVTLAVLVVVALAVHVWFLVLLMTHGSTLDSEPTPPEPIAPAAASHPTAAPTADEPVGAQPRSRPAVTR